MKTLKDFISEIRDSANIPADADSFLPAEYQVKKYDDRAGNKDDVYSASKVKTVIRSYGKPDGREHGYDPGEDADAWKRWNKTDKERSAPSSVPTYTKEDVDELDEAKSLAKGINHLGKSVFDKRDGRTGVVQNSYTDGSHSIKWKGSKEPTKHDWFETKNHIRIATTKDEHKKYLEEAREESPTKGTRLVSKHEGQNGHHAEVRFNKDWDEYSAHHYHNGKHLGEGPVSYHDNKNDAKDTAEYETKNFKVKNGSLQMEDLQIDDIKEAREASDALRRAQENMRKLKSGAYKNEPKAKKPSKRSEAAEYKERAAFHKKKYDDHKSQHDDLMTMHDEITNGRHGNYGLEKHQVRGAEEELSHQIGGHAKAMTKHANAHRDLESLHYSVTGKWFPKSHQIDESAKLITKKDIIQNTFNRYISERLGTPDQEDILAENIKHVPSLMQGLIFDLYETLSEENKDMVLGLSESEEGINALVDFAINEAE